MSEPAGEDRQSFEQNQVELERIVERLERGDVELEELTRLWERGEELYRLRIRRSRIVGRVERRKREQRQALFLSQRRQPPAGLSGVAGGLSL